MKRRWTTLIGLLTLLNVIHAQDSVPKNLVYNPSFEEHSICPQRIDAIGYMRGVDAWWQPTRGSSDYFHPCGGRECQTPRNKMGYQAPRTGDAYCGIYCSKEHYREYLQTELKEPLVAGRRYRVSYWVSLSDKAPHAVATLGALLTSDLVTDTSWDVLMHREVSRLDDHQHQVISTHYRPQVVNSTDNVLTDATGWQLVQGDFVAAGGERYLTLGNFNTFNHSNVHYVGNTYSVLQGAYYFVDDVEVVCLDCIPQEEITDTPHKDTLQSGDIIKIEGVYFDTDKSDILPQSYHALQQLTTYLNTHPAVQIELRGHTDSQGSTEHNRRLSEARAKAVTEYLIEHGIEPRRLSWKGFGESLPVDTNDTDEGRQHNRRVEYRIVSP